jgi:hypothetical protein
MLSDFPDDLYASHLPLLSGLGCIRGGVKSILELGSGMYSTPMFLNRAFYPHVTRMVSVDHNSNWAERVRSTCKDDRLEMVVTTEPIEPYLSTLDLESFDLIFVDNSDVSFHREATIEYLGVKVMKPLVVIHDFQYPQYQKSAHNFPNKIIDTRYGPHYTGLVWKSDSLSFGTLTEITCRVKQY